MEALRSDEIEEMKKIFFELLKKWTTSDNKTGNISKPMYYPKSEEDPIFTVENLTDLPLETMHEELLKKNRLRRSRTRAVTKINTNQGD